MQKSVRYHITQNDDQPVVRSVPVPHRPMMSVHGAQDENGRAPVRDAGAEATRRQATRRGRFGIRRTQSS